MKAPGASTQHDHSHAQNRFAVIPTALRLNAQNTYTGKGVMIALLDSGFSPHPDLTAPQNRILVFHDVTNSSAKLNADQMPPAWAWHGTQTSVVAAGNGHLSDGIYRGLASDAAVVLVKVSERGWSSGFITTRLSAWCRPEISTVGRLPSVITPGTRADCGARR
jgi:hypothetical protein